MADQQQQPAFDPADVMSKVDALIAASEAFRKSVATEQEAVIAEANARVDLQTAQDALSKAHDNVVATMNDVSDEHDKVEAAETALRACFQPIGVPASAPVPVVNDDTVVGTSNTGEASTGNQETKG